MNIKKSLVVYYSLEWNTKLIAEKISKEIDADILECKIKKDISPKWFMKYIRWGKQIFMKEKPELLKLKKDPLKYENIIIWTPVRVWTYVPAIRSFFDKVKLKNKKIALFCTHEWWMWKTLQNMENKLNWNYIMETIDFLNVQKNIDESIKKAKDRAFKLKSNIMPTKKTQTKKTAEVTANFSAKLPEDIMDCCKNHKTKKSWWKNSGWFFYFLWFIGAAVYYISIATGFRIGVLGVLKAIVRPAFLVYELFKFLAIS